MSGGRVPMVPDGPSAWSLEKHHRLAQENRATGLQDPVQLEPEDLRLISWNVATLS